MRKTTLGTAAGVVLAAGLAAALLTTGGASTAPTQHAQAAGASEAEGVRHLVLADRSVADVANAAATTAPRTPPKAVAPKPVRKLVLSLPATAEFGTNVNGLAALEDVTRDNSTPVAGVTVSFQQLRGSRYVGIADGVTDENGQVPISFTSQGTTTWRAVAALAGGKTLTSAVARTLSTAVVTWAARPVLDTTAGIRADYAFRVLPGVGAKGGLQYALTADKPKWVLIPAVKAGADGVVRQHISFPKAGTYLVRGASAVTPTTAVGTTTALTVTVG